jgi:type IV pilus assembly protein PilV
MKPRLSYPILFLQRGGTLLEALITVLIFSIGVLGIVGLQAAKIKETSDAKYRFDSSFLAQQRVGEMWADPNNLANYVEANTDISAQLPAGTRTTTLPAAGQVRVVITWQQPGSPDTHSFTLNTSVSGG